MHFLLRYFAAIAISCAAMMQVHYEPAVVRLSGLLSLEEHYGPPNFGETPDVDVSERIIVLKLDSPIVVTADPSDGANRDSFSNVKKVQLSGSVVSGLYARVGNHVVVEGSLFEKQSSEHFTDVLMTARSVTNLPQN